MTQTEAHRKRLCLCCGVPGAHLLRARDGRNVRACDRCLCGCQTCEQMTSGAVEREPVGCEVTP